MTDSQTFQTKFKILIQKLPNDIKDNGNDRQKLCYSIILNTKTQLWTVVCSVTTFEEAKTRQKN